MGSLPILKFAGHGPMRGVNSNTEEEGKSGLLIPDYNLQKDIALASLCNMTTKEKVRETGLLMSLSNVRQSAH